jgi:hypothetical protein
MTAAVGYNVHAVGGEKLKAVGGVGPIAELAVKLVAPSKFAGTL